MAQAMVDSGEWTRATADASPLEHVLVSALGSPEVDPQVRSLDLERRGRHAAVHRRSHEARVGRGDSRASASRRSIRVGLPIADRPRPRPWGQDNVTVVMGKARDGLTRSLWCVACMGCDGTITFAPHDSSVTTTDRVMAAPASLSLERKLPLLISVLLAALAVGLTAAGYHEVKQASEAPRHRAPATAHQSARGACPVRPRSSGSPPCGAWPRDSAVVAYLLGAESDTGRQRACRWRAARTLDLLDRHRHRRRASANERGDSSLRRRRRSRETKRAGRGADRQAEGRPTSHGRPAFPQRLRVLLGWRAGDRSGRVLGHVLLRRTFSSSPRAERQIRDLAGGDQVSIYVASDNAAKWASLSGRAAPAPALTRDSARRT